MSSMDIHRSQPWCESLKVQGVDPSPFVNLKWFEFVTRSTGPLAKPWVCLISRIQRTSTTHGEIQYNAYDLLGESFSTNGTPWITLDDPGILWSFKMTLVMLLKRIEMDKMLLRIAPTVDARWWLQQKPCRHLQTNSYGTKPCHNSTFNAGRFPDLKYIENWNYQAWNSILVCFLAPVFSIFF